VSAIEFRKREEVLDQRRKIGLSPTARKRLAEVAVSRDMAGGTPVIQQSKIG
jgi:hypothetical protein